MLARDAAEVAAVTEPMILFSQSTVPVDAILMPYTLLPLVPPVVVTEPVPSEDPIVLPNEVPIFTFPASMYIPVQAAFPELSQLMLLIVLFWTELAVVVPAFM